MILQVVFTWIGVFLRISCKVGPILQGPKRTVLFSLVSRKSNIKMPLVLWICLPHLPVPRDIWNQGSIVTWYICKYIQGTRRWGFAYVDFWPAFYHGMNVTSPEKNRKATHQQLKPLQPSCCLSTLALAVKKKSPYCWWFRNPAITTWDVYSPTNNGRFSISTGAGFLPWKQTQWVISKRLFIIFGFLFWCQKNKSPHTVDGSEIRWSPPEMYKTII